VNFNTSAGTLTVRAKNGTGGASLSVGSAIGGTSLNRTNTFDVTGHSVDMLLSSLVLGSYTQGATANTGSFTNVFSFDTGTLSAGTVTIGNRTGTIPSGNTGAIVGTVNLGGGTVTVTGSGSSAVLVANASGSSSGTGTNTVTGTLNVTGGAVTLTNGGITLASNSDTGTTGYTNTVTGTLAVSGGSLTVGGAITPGATTGPGGATSTLTLSGTGTMNMQNNNIGNVTNFNFTGGTLKNAGTISRGVTQSGGSLVRDAAGTTTIAGAYNLTGAAATATVSAGAVLVNGSAGSAAGTGTITSTGSGTFGGAGTVNGNVVISGGLAPGNNAVGTLTHASGTMTWNPAGTYAFEYDPTQTGNASTTTSDFVNGAGTLNLSNLGTAAGQHFVLNLIPAFNAAPGTADVTYTLATYAGGVTTPAGLAGTDLTPYFDVTGQFASQSGGPTVTLSGNSVLVTFTPVPEPAHALLACAAVAFWRRGRRISQVFGSRGL
jgi:hypothetical protein